MPKVVTQLWNETEFLCARLLATKIEKHPFQTTTQLSQRHTRTHNDNHASCQEVIRNTSFLNLELIIAQASRETAGMMNKADPSE